MLPPTDRNFVSSRLSFASCCETQRDCSARVQGALVALPPLGRAVGGGRTRLEGVVWVQELELAL